MYSPWCSAFFRRFVYVWIAFTWPCFAQIPSADLGEILDAPNLSFELDVTQGKVQKSETTKAKGTSSLVARSSFDPQENKPHLFFHLRINVAGPGRLIFKARSNSSPLNYFQVGNADLREELPSDTLPNVWYEMTYYVRSNVDQVELAMWPLGLPESVEFYFDDFSFEPGIEIRVDDIPAAGSLVLSPLKELYAIGEEIQVGVSKINGISVTSVSEMDYVNGVLNTHPASFKLVASNHVTLKPQYRQAVKISNLSASVDLQNETVPNDLQGPFNARTIVVTNLPAKSLLVFDAALLRYREINITGANRVYASEPSIASDLEDQDFQTYHVFIEEAEPRLELSVYTNRLPSDQHYSSFRKLSLAQGKSLAIAKTGLGTVETTYQEIPRSGSIKANVVATPDENWEFVAWNGLASSSDPELELLIDGPRFLSAQFGQVFERGASRWTFVHDGRFLIKPTQDGLGFELPANSGKGQVTVLVEATGRGLFSAKTHYLASSPSSGAYYEPTFYQDHEVGAAPLRLEKTFYFPFDSKREIRDIRVSGGNGYNDVAFSLHAPTGSVTIEPSKSNYALGDRVRLSVNPTWRSRFIGWFGDRYSNAAELDILIDGPIKLSALFKTETQTRLGHEVSSRGTVLSELSGTDQDITFQSTTLPQGAWTEIQIDVASPTTVGLKFLNDFANLSVSYYMGEQSLVDVPPPSTDGIVYCKLPAGTSGPLRVRISNQLDSPATGSLKVLGFYQDTRDWIPFVFTNSVQLTPDTRYAPIGSYVTIEATNNLANLEFDAWIDRSETKQIFQLLVEEGKTVVLRPRFVNTSNIKGLTFLPDQAESWMRSGDNSYYDDNEFESGETHTISLIVEGPGVLAFNQVLHDWIPLTQLQMLIDGKPTRFGEFGISEGHAIEALIDSGLHTVEIETSLNDFAIENDLQPQPREINGFALIKGFAVIGEPDQPYAAWPESPKFPPVYPASTTLTILPSLLSDADFSGWQGDLAGQPKKAIVKIDRHIVANGREKLSKQVKSTSIQISGNAIFSSQSIDGNSITYYVESASGTTTLTFSVPAMHELAFSLNYAGLPVRVETAGEIVYQGEPGLIDFGFPVKENSQTVTLTLELDPEKHRQVWITDIRSSNQFALYGDFGDAQEYLTAEPFKDTYEPGGIVTVKLTDKAPKDWVFYDMGTILPNLGLFDWLNVEGKRSFEIEMVSETALIGKIGKMPLRAKGEVVFSDNLSYAPSSEAAPNGTTSTQATFLDSDTAYVRIFCPSSKHVDFWIKAPEGQDWVSVDSNPFEIPFAFSGSGKWQQVSLAVPNESNYLSFFIDNQVPGTNSFLISKANPISGYSIPFLANAGGSIQKQPAGGTTRASQVIQLTAVPSAGYSFQSWTSEQFANEPTFTGRPDQIPFLLPTFKRNPIFLDFAELQAEVTSESSPSWNEETQSLDFIDSNTSVQIEFQGPGRFIYSTDHFASDGKIEVRIDGELTRQHNRYTTSSNMQEIEISSGRHVVEILYSEISDASKSSIFGINFEQGTYLTIRPFIQGGTIHANSQEHFLPLGSSVTVEADPNQHFQFDHWVGSISKIGTANPLTLKLTDHTVIDAYFRYQAELTVNGLRWLVKEDKIDPNLHIGTTEVVGPGYLVIDSNLSWSSAFAVRVNGLVVPTTRIKYNRIVTVPSGRHRIEISAPAEAELFAYGTTYTKGLLFTLLGDGDGLIASPVQKSYLKGSSVNVKVPDSHSVPVWIGEELVSPGESRNYTIEDHLLLDSKFLLPFGDRLRTNAIRDQVQFVPLVNGTQAIQISGGFSESIFLEGDFEGPADFVLEIDDIAGAVLSLFIDGVFIGKLDLEKQNRFPLTSGRSTVRVLFERDASLVKAGIPRIRFFDTVPTTLSDYEHWLAETLPAYDLVRRIKLGPDDDLDGDGRTNQQEKLSHTPPHIYDIALTVSEPIPGQPSIQFELSKEQDLSKIYLLYWGYENQLPGWESVPLSLLPYRSENDGARTRIIVPTKSVNTNATLFRVGIKTY